MSENGRERVKIEFKYQAGKNTSEALLFEYIKSNPFLEKKELVLQAIKLLWLPLAYQESGLYSSSEVMKIGEKSVAMLINHINFICQTLGLPKPDFSTEEIETNQAQITEERSEEFNLQEIFIFEK
jgi:hypothetical protein